jgi:nicotinic acid phosphoribosyltransferase
MTSTALLTDRYELTMLDAALHDGTGQRPCAFEMFARELPDGRRFGVVAGTERWIDALANFRFGQAELDMLDDDHVVSADTLRWLADYRFTGDVDGYREGELYFANSPVLTVRGTFAEAVLLESLTLSVFNHDSAIASAGARMVQAAGDRGLLEFGSRRTHELAAVDAARAAVLVGFSGTSNLEAGRRYGVPTLGTSAHAFTLIHDDETAAFDAQVAALGRGTTLLIDTYDIPDGLQRAIDVAGEELGGVRIDSGDLAREARRAREQLDAAGLTETKIIASGDLDEHEDRRVGRGPDRRIRGRHRAGHGLRCPGGRLRLQAGRPRDDPRRRTGARRQGGRGQGHDRGMQGRSSAVGRRARHRGGAPPPRHRPRPGRAGPAGPDRPPGRTGLRGRLARGAGASPLRDRRATPRGSQRHRRRSDPPDGDPDAGRLAGPT